MGEFREFETERLHLRPTSIADADFIFELVNSPKWLQFIGDRKVRNSEEAKDYIRHRMLPQLEKLGFSNYTVIRKEDSKKIGSCGLYDRKGLAEIDLGFAFLSEFEGMGYAYEAASVLRDAARKYFNLKKLQAITLNENHGSRKLLDKLGFVFTERIKIPNDPEELLLYELVFENYS